MNKFLRIGLTTFLLSLLLAASLSGIHAAAGISLAALDIAYTQNFDTLVNTGTAATVPAGWSFNETGTSANTTYTAGTGSSNSGDTYSFGSAGSTERAFGGVQSTSLIPTVGVCFTNNTGKIITSLDITYIGEQWRLGTAARADRLDFQYSVDATSLTTGVWTNVDALDFSSPNTAAAVGALDGNAAANRTAISATISGLNIADGATFFLRWNDFNATGADDGLAVDDFSLIPKGGGAPPPPPTILPIHTIQGSGNSSPFATTSVTAKGIVTGIKSN